MSARVTECYSLLLIIFWQQWSRRYISVATQMTPVCLFMKVLNMEPCQAYLLNLWQQDLLWHRLLNLYGEKLLPRRLICCFMKSIGPRPCLLLSPHHIQFIFCPPLWFCSSVGITEPSTHVDHSPQCKLVPVRTDCRIDVSVYYYAYKPLWWFSFPIYMTVLLCVEPRDAKTCFTWTRLNFCSQLWAEIELLRWRGALNVPQMFLTRSKSLELIWFVNWSFLEIRSMLEQLIVTVSHIWQLQLAAIA